MVEDSYASDLWVSPEGVSDKAQQITTGENVISASWLTNDYLVIQNTHGDLVRFDRDGRNRLLLTADTHNNTHPSGCGDGRHIVFESSRSGDNVWAIGSDGSSPVRLTHGDGESFPVCSPNGKWALYLDVSKDLAVWKVPVEGGNPVRSKGWVQPTGLSNLTRRGTHCLP